MSYVIVHYTKDMLSTYALFLIHFTDVCYTGNEAYNIVDHAEKFSCSGAGTSGDKEQTKEVYEEVYI